MTFTARLIDVRMDDARRSYLDTTETIALVPGQDRDIWQSFKASSAGISFYPEADATLFRFFVLPPPDEALSEVDLQAVAGQFFAANNIEHCRTDTSRNPFMHTTPTSDCVMLLSGRVQLLLDEGAPVDLKPFDVVRQRETNHSWINLGPGPAVLISLMHGVAQK